MAAFTARGASALSPRLRLLAPFCLDCLRGNQPFRQAHSPAGPVSGALCAGLRVNPDRVRDSRLPDPGHAPHHQLLPQGGPGVPGDLRQAAGPLRSPAIGGEGERPGGGERAALTHGAPLQRAVAHHGLRSSSSRSWTWATACTGSSRAR